MNYFSFLPSFILSLLFSNLFFTQSTDAVNKKASNLHFSAGLFTSLNFDYNVLTSKDEIFKLNVGIQIGALTDFGLLGLGQSTDVYQGNIYTSGLLGFNKYFLEAGLGFLTMYNNREIENPYLFVPRAFIG